MNQNQDPAYELTFDNTVFGTIDSDTTLYYWFNLDQFTNITITIATIGNLSIEFPFGFQYHTENTNFGNLSRSFYATPEYHTLMIKPELGFSRDFSITLSHGKPVIDYQNHEIETAYAIQENEVISQIVNVTYFGSEYHTTQNYYSLKINQSGYYRFNLKDKLSGNWVFFSLDGNGISNQSYSFGYDSETISQTLMIYLNPGSYTLKVEGQSFWFYYPEPFDLWYTSLFEVNTRENVGVNEEIYGIVSDLSVDVYTYSATMEEVIWFETQLPDETGLDVLVSVSGSGNTSLVQADRREPESLVYIPSAGNYTLTVQAQTGDYQDYLLKIHRIEPDRLEEGNNSKENPLELLRSTSESYSLHLPSDVDWFSITVTFQGTSRVRIILDHDIDLTVYNGTQIVPLTLEGDNWAWFNSTSSFDATYILKVSANTSVPSYSIGWNFFALAETTSYHIFSTPNASSHLKIGYQFGETLFLIALPLILILRFRKQLV